MPTHYVPETGKLGQDYLAEYTKTARQRGPWSTASPTASLAEITVSEISFLESAYRLFEAITYSSLRFIKYTAIYGVVAASVIVLIYSWVDWSEVINKVSNLVQLPSASRLFEVAVDVAVVIGHGFLFLLQGILYLLWDFLQALWPPNTKRIVVKRYNVARAAIADVSAWTDRKIIDLRYNRYTDWVWLKFYQISNWFANHALLVVFIFIVIFLFSNYFAEEGKKINTQRYVPPPEPDRYRGSITYEVARPTPREKISPEIPEPTAYWGLYGEAIRKHNSEMKALSERDERAKPSPGGFDKWVPLDDVKGDIQKLLISYNERQKTANPSLSRYSRRMAVKEANMARPNQRNERAQKSPSDSNRRESVEEGIRSSPKAVPPKDDFPGNFWKNPQPEGHPVTYVSKDLHYCMACKQVRELMGRMIEIDPKLHATIISYMLTPMLITLSGIVVSFLIDGQKDGREQNHCDIHHEE